MHLLQEKLLKIIGEKNIGTLTLREIGTLIGERLPQKVKHHLSQLEAKGFIAIDSRQAKITRINSGTRSQNFLLSIPILGSASCGPATIYADENIEGYLKISRNLVSKQKGVFALKAQGQSLNKSNIAGKTVDPGDFIIVDSSQINPRDGDYILCVINGLATVKKFRRDTPNERIVLLSESTQSFNPIFIHRNDEFHINGKAIDVVKKFE